MVFVGKLVYPPRMLVHFLRKILYIFYFNIIIIVPKSKLSKYIGLHLQIQNLDLFQKMNSISSSTHPSSSLCEPRKVVGSNMNKELSIYVCWGGSYFPTLSK
jgi:hypothetical protein